ncbi:MAG TPA: AlpA family phage regulatory protein [Candidatus Ozemobacteraceae bacterium]|nr:AlpA family phage regulatory protein [Candidatus Ozemobacteraceae bacterium]
MNQPSLDGLLRISQICGDRKRGIPAIVPVSRSTWWAGVASGRFPAPVRLGSKLTFWKAADIRALLEKLGAAS